MRAAPAVQGLLADGWAVRPVPLRHSHLWQQTKGDPSQPAYAGSTVHAEPTCPSETAQAGCANGMQTCSFAFRQLWGPTSETGNQHKVKTKWSGITEELFKINLHFAKDPSPQTVFSSDELMACSLLCKLAGCGWAGQSGQSVVSCIPLLQKVWSCLGKALAAHPGHCILRSSACIVCR